MNGNMTIDKCYNSGNVSVTGDNAYSGGITATATHTTTNSHNTGNITSKTSGQAGEITAQGTAGTGCTYLLKTSNANSNGATGMANMTNTMSLSNFVTLMNSYVTTNNANSSNTQLKTWKLQGSYPVFSN